MIAVVRAARAVTAAAAATAALTALTAVALAVPATALAAGWTRPQAVQPGGHPVLTFSPTGAAALGSQLTAHGRPSGTDIDLAPNGVRFTASPYTLAAPRAGHTGPESLAALALSSAGYLAASFADPDAAAPVLARVAPPAPSRFTSAVQPLIPAGNLVSGQGTADTFALVATGRGELVGAGTDDAGRLDTATLAARRTTFTTASGPRGFSATDAYALTADGSGNAFLAGDGPTGCSTVAFRPAHRTFTTTYATRNCSSAAPNIFDAIAASSHGEAGLLSEDVSEAGTEPNRLFVQVGADGRFGAATELGAVLGGPVGLAADADGELTAEWTNCRAGTITDGQLGTTACDIDAATGSVTRGFSAKAAAGTPLAAASAGTTLTALTADRAVAISRCAATRCSFTVTTAQPGGGFRSAHPLGRGTRLVTLTGDDHGDLLAVWADPRNHLYAATGSAASGRWSSDHRLSATAVDPAAVTAVYGPDGRALVAWSVANRTYAASYAL